MIKARVVVLAQTQAGHVGDNEMEEGGGGYLLYVFLDQHFFGTQNAGASQWLRLAT